jgi:predicted transposase/invertase (TIGR01784 family)
MRKPWDRRMKQLFREAPQDLVEWIIPDAKFITIVSPELEGEPIFTDILFEVLLNEERTLLHVEFQKKRDSHMAERLWKYNVRATLQYHLPVWSCVIYLKKVSTVVKPFLIKELSNGRSIHRFDFQVIKLWEIPKHKLKEKGLVGLLPLLVLTQDGARREVVEEAIEGLTATEEESNAELLTLTYWLASLAFQKEADQDWLARRFSMLYDMLRETRAYKEMAKESHEEGREEGLEEGLREGLQKGQVESLRKTLHTLVQARFSNSTTTRIAKGQAALIDDPAILQDLIIKVGLARTIEEAQKHLLEWPGADNEDAEQP